MYNTTVSSYFLDKVSLGLIGIVGFIIDVAVLAIVCSIVYACCKSVGMKMDEKAEMKKKKQEERAKKIEDLLL